MFHQRLSAFRPWQTSMIVSQFPAAMFDDEKRLLRAATSASAELRRMIKARSKWLIANLVLDHRAARFSYSYFQKSATRRGRWHPSM